MDSAVEQLALSVRRISQEQDALFNIFRSGSRIIGGGEQKGKRSRSTGSGKKEEEEEDDRDQIREDKGRMEEASEEDIEEGNVGENVELVKSNGNNDTRELNKTSNEQGGEDAANLKSKGETQLSKESAKHTEQVQSEEKKKNQRQKDEKKTKKRRPPLFVDIPSAETEMAQENPPKEERWSVSIPIIRTDQQGRGTTGEEEDRVTDPVRMRREPDDKTMKSVNIPILRSVEPEKVKLEKLVAGKEELENGTRCNNDDGPNHNGIPATSSTDVSDEMRRVISKLRQVKGELERENVDQYGGKPERIADEKLGETNEAWSDTDGEDYIEATGPTSDPETDAGEKHPGPMSPLVSQIVEIRQFIKNFRRSVADEEWSLNSEPNSVSNNSETVEVSGKRIGSEKSSPRRIKRNWSLRDGNLIDQDGRSQDRYGRSQEQDRDGRDQDRDQHGKGGLFWASPALVKEEDEKIESDGGSYEDEKAGTRSKYLILPSSPKNSTPVISPRKKKVSVTSFTMKKVSVTSPEWNSDNHHTFVHLI